MEYLTGSRDAIEHLRIDVEKNDVKFYTLPDAPKDIFKEGYAEKCYTFAAAFSGSGIYDYLVLLALRPDWEKAGGGKVIDIDTAAFCFKSNSLDAYPTGVALLHQNYSGRTEPLPGFQTYTLEQTVNQLHSTLTPGSQPLSGSPQPYINAISHSIAKLNQEFGPEISGWDSAYQASTRLEIPIEPVKWYPGTPTGNPPGTGSPPSIGNPPEAESKPDV